MLGLKLIHVSKSGPRYLSRWAIAVAVAIDSNYVACLTLKQKFCHFLWDPQSKRASSHCHQMTLFLSPFDWVSPPPLTIAGMDAPHWWKALFRHKAMFVSAISDTLTHWDRVTHICVSKLTIIGSDNGLSPGRRQAIIWTNAGIWLIRTLGKTSVKSKAKFIHFHSRKCIWKCRLRNGVYLVSASMS